MRSTLHDPADFPVAGQTIIRELAAAVRDGSGGDPTSVVSGLRFDYHDDPENLRLVYLGDSFNRDRAQATLAPGMTTPERRFWEAVALGHMMLQHPRASATVALFGYLSTAQVYADAGPDPALAAEALLFAEAYVGDELASAARDAIAALGGPE